MPLQRAGSVNARNVRNFWIEADVDGASSKLSGGPRNSEGGFELTIYMREEGEAKTAMHIVGMVDTGGELVLKVGAAEDHFEIRTKR
jgi:hypothetical protein